jgi:3-hydroxyacyl-CoA dehydrogenase/enoyl-CoA hydratase/3-hydroxybutyryl-CoA epimerase
VHLEHFSFEVIDGIAVVRMDRAGESMNTIGPDLFSDFATILDRLQSDDSISGVVWTSAKKDFLAGADIRWFETLDRDAAETAITEAHHQFARLEALHRDAGKPVVAAIRGACLGGGLEMALLASSRIAADTERTQLGQPEVQLGVIPAGGGTQRLPRLVGVATALDLILTGRSITPRKAKAIGLVDEVVPDERLLDAAMRRAAMGASRPARRSLRHRLTDTAVQGNPIGRGLLFRRAEAKMLAETKGNYPAPARALEAVRIGLEHGPERGLEAEARFFAELVVSPESRALRSIFFAGQELKRERWVGDAVARPWDKVGVLGGGLMGGGIAAISAWKAGATVRIKEVDDAGVRRGLGYVAKVLAGRVARRRMTEFEAERIRNRVTATTDWSGFGTVDIVIEAVFEDLELKRSTLQEAETATPPETIFASNTSSLPISAIAEASARPETVVGMHYFSPVERMPLLEVITTDHTAGWVTATAVDLGRAQGKTVIVVNDGTGFYTTRILGPYTNEAAFLLEDGASIEAIDGAMVQWGFPVGPILLMDEVGIDVGAKIARIMVEAFGERMRGPAMMEGLVTDDRKGRKNRKGFYRYDDTGKRGRADPSVYSALGLGPRRPISQQVIQERLSLALINEAARCLDDAILRSARDGDVGAVMGIGFPPFRGGPFWWVDEIGAKDVVSRLDALRDEHGDRFAAAGILRRHADEGQGFRS